MSDGFDIHPTPCHLIISRTSLKPPSTLFWGWFSIICYLPPFPVGVQQWNQLVIVLGKGPTTCFSILPISLFCFVLFLQWFFLLQRLQEFFYFVYVVPWLNIYINGIFDRKFMWLGDEIGNWRLNTITITSNGIFKNPRRYSGDT